MGLAAGAAMPVFLVGALGVQIKDAFAIGDPQLGVLLGGFFGVAALTTAFGGRLADRIGWRRAAWLTAVAAVATLLSIAVIARAYSVLLLLLLLGGTSFALSNPTSNLMLFQEMPRERLGLLFGIKQAAVPVATFLAGLSVPLIALTVGWRWAFVAAALVPLAAALVAPRSGGEPVAASSGRPQPWRTNVSGALLVLALAGALASAAVGALNAFLVVSGVAAGLPEAAAGLLVSVASLAGLVVRVTSGWIADRRRTGGLRSVAALLVVGALGFALLATGRALAVVLGALLAYGGGWGWNGLFHFGVVHHNVHAPGTASGVTQTGLSAGVALGPIAFGLVAARWGYAWAWSGVAAITVIAAILMAIGAAWSVRD